MSDPRSMRMIQSEIPPSVELVRARGCSHRLRCWEGFPARTSDAVVIRWLGMAELAALGKIQPTAGAVVCGARDWFRVARPKLYALAKEAAEDDLVWLTFDGEICDSRRDMPL